MNCFKKSNFMALLMILALIVFAPAIYSADDTQAASLDDMLSDDTIQDARGEDVSVEKAENKIFDANDLLNNIWLVADPKLAPKLLKEFPKDHHIFKVFISSNEETTPGIEKSLNELMETKKPDVPVLMLSTIARPMQSDEARLKDNELRENLKSSILKRVKKDAKVELSTFKSANTPYSFMKVTENNAVETIKELDKQIAENSPIFILPYTHTIKGSGDNAKECTEALIEKNVAHKIFVKLSESAKDTEINGETVTFDKKMMVKVSEHFNAPVGAKVIVIGSPDELGGLSEKEFAYLAVYFRVCRVWGSNAKETTEAVKKYVNGTLKGVKPEMKVAKAGQSSGTEIFDKPITGTVEVNTTLNMRSAPWGNIVGKLNPGSQISIVGKKGDWFIAEINGNRVFVHGNYISTPGNPASRVTPTPPGGANTGSTTPSSTPGNVGTPPPSTLPSGSLNAGKYGFDPKRYGPIYDILEKYSKLNKKYSNKSDSDRRYHGKDHWTDVTDCSGLVGHFIDKLADASGIKSPINRGWYPDSQTYRGNYTTKITSGRPPTNPRDLIHPGDLFVMRREGGKYGHIGMFMGYTSSGAPIIAHSTGGTAKSSRTISGNVGTTGTRIEVMPQSYFSDSRWDGIFRLKNMDRMLDALSA